MKRLLVLATLLLAAWGLAACGSRPVTAQRLDAAVGPTFSRLYVVQQRELGHPGSAAPPSTSAQCYRGAAAASTPDPNAGAAVSVAASGPQQGPGDDWTCVVDFPFPDGHVQPIAYDLTVQTTGCYTADGPTAVVGQQRILAADGRTVTNPLFAFDGCIDIG